ncbi:hypothetical protein E1B28_008450 [Marasmius oreades]|uniref:Uncharacterized protein n=1 Tax=Marasmius oreades TaxID=181124 RepID=A0A9P7RYJ4_9AGAR|nr:uncharacterized protein E1B28_008450 [Marasmius oreades]KAG7092069.1 hypothetical protein E1B28_008450 [Marasmius oreades]
MSKSKENNLPPKRDGHKGTRPVKPPLHSTRLHKFIYILVLLSTIMTAYYSYRLLQWKTNVGGWWNLAVGRKPAQVMHDSSGQPQRERAGRENESVEDRINALAQALGMPPKDLAQAIAGAVREYVPPASLSSIRAKETTGPAVDVLLGEKAAPEGSEGHGKAEGGANSGTGGVMDSFVGFDEP